MSSIKLLLYFSKQKKEREKKRQRAETSRNWTEFLISASNRWTLTIGSPLSPRAIIFLSRPFISAFLLFAQFGGYPHLKKATLRWLSRQVQAPTGNIPKVLVYAYTGKITGISNYINVEPALSIQSDWR